MYDVPFPLNPDLHLQPKLPSVLLHTACVWQLCMPLEHSSKFVDGQGIEKKTKLCSSQIRRSISSTHPHLTTYISQAVNNIRYFLHYFRLKRLRSFLNLEKKKWRRKDSIAERTWIEDHSLKNIQSIHLGNLRVDQCRWENIHQTISATATNLPADLLALQLQALAIHWHKAFFCTLRAEVQFSGEWTTVKSCTKAALD